jgi:CSLREA domain-containing protein
METKSVRYMALFFSMLALILCLPKGANAEGHVIVNSTDDVVDNEDGKCTLREAIHLANTNVTNGKAGGECKITVAGDQSDKIVKTVHIPEGTFTLSIPSGCSYNCAEKNTEFEGDLLIKSDITIDAKGDETIIDGSGLSSSYGGDMDYNGVFTVVKGATVTIMSVTIENAIGPGIRNGGTLTVKNSKISKGQSYGVKNFGTLTITDSVISGNKGGVHHFSGSANITDTTISDNNAEDGGGMHVSGEVVIANSSFINNKADDKGGAILNFGTLEVKNTTFTKNTAKSGGNVIYNDDDGYVSISNSTIFANIGASSVAITNESSDKDFEMQNTILLGNGADECKGEITANGGNIIGNIPNCSLKLKSTDKTWQQMTMGAFKDFGAPGRAFFPLKVGNVALGAGDIDECEKKDQIKHTRKQKCDTGAVEAMCGDGEKNSTGEECDDGNDKDNDECTNNCKIVKAEPKPSNTIASVGKCGDGKVQAKLKEECDDGNQKNTDVCTNKCTKAKCGDGIIWNKMEQCDDGNQIDTDSCTNKCLKAVVAPAGGAIKIIKIQPKKK